MPTVRDYHSVMVSLMEELEAVDWYNRRIATCQDEELKRILMHNRDEEVAPPVHTRRDRP